MSNEMKLDFNDLITIIETSRATAQKAVNQELILMYWKVGEYLHNLTLNASFGDKVIDEVAKYIKEKNPTLKGFTKRGLYRMKQFHETYVDDEFVSTVLTQIIVSPLVSQINLQVEQQMLKSAYFIRYFKLKQRG